MLIFALDDEPLLLRKLCRTVREAEPNAEIRDFTRASAALAAIEEEGVRPDVVFLDIEMPGMTGLELAKRMKLSSPKSNIIFVTGFTQYAAESMSLYPSGYVVKPVTAERVRQELEHLRHPVLPDTDHRVRLHCFGNFEAFIDGQPMRFHYEKTKELLAFLTDRGTLCTNEEIMAVLWEKEVSASYFRNVRKDLLDTFRSAGCGDVLVQRRGMIGLLPEKVQCDYYDWQKGESWAMNAYRGEYMSQYSWGEFTHGALEADERQI